MNTPPKLDVHVSYPTLTETTSPDLILSTILVKYANVGTIDLADYDRPGGKARLTKQLRQHVHQLGMMDFSYR